MPTRRLLLETLYNVRDLGGFPTKDGRITKFGVFVRSEAPVGLTPQDLNRLKSYGVTASMDFRSSGEMNARPSDLRECFTYYPRPLFHEAAIPGGARLKPPPKKIRWGEQYIEMAEGSRDWAIDVLNLAAKQDGALLYHCTTGKDRTGLMTCYLLSIAGVSRADIAADYCVSQIYLEPVYQKMRNGEMNLGPAPAGMQDGGQEMFMSEDFFKTPPEAMLTLIDYLDQTYGSVVAYLHSIGVTEETMDVIRKKFTETEII